jgi:hypothetical protein
MVIFAQNTIQVYHTWILKKNVSAWLDSNLTPNQIFVCHVVFFTVMAVSAVMLISDAKHVIQVFFNPVEGATNVMMAAQSVVIFLVILVQIVCQVISLLLIILAKAVKDSVLHVQKQMFVRVAVQVDLSL